jgi:hypothetical protein
MLSHTQERKFKCTFANCTLSFLNAQHLKSHTAVHLKPTPFACTQPNCGMAFSTKSKLLRHATVHTGKRPYPCLSPDCSMTFEYPSAASRHFQLVHSRNTITVNVASSHPATTNNTTNMDAPSTTTTTTTNRNYDAQHSSTDTDTINAMQLETTTTTTMHVASLFDESTDDETCRRRRVQCELCSKMIRRSGMRAHLKTHASDRRLYYCTYPVQPTLLGTAAPLPTAGTENARTPDATHANNAHTSTAASPTAASTGGSICGRVFTKVCTHTHTLSLSVALLLLVVIITTDDYLLRSNPISMCTFELCTCAFGSSSAAFATRRSFTSKH